MSTIKRLTLNTKAFVIDYCARHKHPLNASLHLVGVPMVFIGLAQFLTGKIGLGALLFVVGYLLQYLGHRAQGNEVGEVTLAKKLWQKLRTKEDRKIDGH